MLIDTHTHAPDLNGVAKIVYSSSDPMNIRAVFDTARNNPDIFCTIGIHPSYIGAEPDYESLLADPKVVGVGEIGLDYHYDAAHKKEQIELFRKQLEIAKRASLPVAIHSREADDDAMGVLADTTGGVLHCFTSGYDFARAMLDRGFYVSASGIITFKNSETLRETFAKIPLDRIVAETDAPWCAPVPYRGQDAAPAMVIETIKVLAGIKNVPLVEMENILWDNAHRLYKKLCQERL